jgi:tetratricopeptide (TPR) repeat protein
MCRKVSFTGDHIILALFLDTRGYLLESWGNMVAAERHYRDALEMFQRLPSQPNPYTAVNLANLANLYVQIGALGQAEGLLGKAREVLHQQTGQQWNWAREHLKSVSGIHASKSGVASGEALLLESYQRLRQHHGPHRMYTQRALMRLVAFYEFNGQSDKAGEHRALLDDAQCMAPM